PPSKHPPRPPHHATPRIEHRASSIEHPATQPASLHAAYSMVQTQGRGACAVRRPAHATTL
ncbi:MAG: hypothetical protein J0L73_27965, partial [Verrucomicrobia bacterium]|nr:hypothetical protein [Verrucomicrobiota bacterium]